MTLSLAAAGILLGESAILFGYSIYSALSTPSKNYDKQLRENISSDITNVLIEAKGRVEHETGSRLHLAKDENGIVKYSQAFHSGLIAGYERPENAVSPVAGQSVFLDYVFEEAQIRGGVMYKNFEEPDKAGMMNPRRVPLEEIVELAKIAFEEEAGVSYTWEPW